MTHHVLHDAGGENAKLRISDAYREDLVTIEEHYYARDEVATALGLVTREDFDKAVALSEARQTELEEAQAILERARELLPVTLHAALSRNPAFVLPTKAGVRFTAKRVGNLAHTSEFVAISDGDGTALYYIPDSLDGYGTEHHIWPGDRVMREWTDHRLIGAES